MVQRFLRRPEVEKATGLSRSTIYDLIAQKDSGFPKPVKLNSQANSRAVGWIEQEIIDWQNDRIAKRNQHAK